MRKPHLSITWITPLATMMSAVVTIAELTKTLPFSTTYYVSPATGPEVRRSGTFQDMKDGDLQKEKSDTDCGR